MASKPGTDAAAHPHPHGSLENPDVAHESTDINVRAILWFTFMLVATTVAISVTMYGLFVAFDRIERKDDQTMLPLMQPAGQRPPNPQLQTTPWTDLKKFRGDEEDYLHSYGWIDEKAGVAHIPIDKAKALLLQKGLPARAGEADPTEGTPVAASGESSGGRRITSRKAGGAQ
jgi:hypothetical protein